ncbi:MAG: hypothetical protein U0174_10765 [Polyangiaceae bacterium]
MPFSRWRASLAGLFALCASLSSTETATANSRIPASNQIIVDIGNPERVVLRTTFGALYSSDRGKNWYWLCEKALRYGGSQDPMLAFTADGNIVGAAFEGLIHSERRDLCNVKIAEGDLTDKHFIDLTSRRAERANILALTGAYSETLPDGGFAYDSDIYRSVDNGITFARVGQKLDRSVTFQTIDVAPSNPLRVYLSGTRGVGPSRTGVVFTSNDGGQTFTEAPFPLVPMSEYAPYIAGVHPLDPDILYVRTSGPAAAPSRLLRSADAGKTFAVVLAFQGPMEGFALNSDGTRVWAGGTADRLHVASTSDHRFERISDVQVQCLTWEAPELWLCSNESTGFIAGRSTDEGRTFEPLLKFRGIRGPLACPSSSVGATCQNEWGALKESLGIPDEARDGGAKFDAGNGGDSTTGSLGGGGCQVQGPATGTLALSGLLLATLAFFRRRNRPSRAAR